MLHINAIISDTGFTDPRNIGQGLRTCYLIADKAIVSGSGYIAVDYERQYSNPNEAFKKDIILREAKRQPNPNHYKEVKNIYDMLHHLNSIKHPKKHDLVFRAQSMKIIDGLYEASLQAIKHAFHTAGYSGLKVLQEEGILETRIWVNEETGEHSLSEPLADKWRNTDELYLLLAPLWKYAQENNLTMSENATNPDAAIWLFPMPEFPYLNTFTAAEMQSIRRDVFSQAGPLRQAIAEWSEKLKAADFGPALAAECCKYYQKLVAPHLNNVTNKFVACSTLEKSKDAHARLIHTNYLAVARAKTIWEYMAWEKMVTKSELHNFEQHYAESANAEKAMLLLLVKPKFDHLPQEEASDKKGLRL